MKNEKNRYYSISQATLGAMLCCVILAALLLVGVSYTLYKTNSKYKYDIARPDVKRSNESAAKDEEVSDTTSKVDARSVQKVADFLQDELTRIETINDFNSDAVSDVSMQLKDASKKH